MNTLYAILGAIALLVGDFYAGYHFGNQHELVKAQAQTIKTAAADVAQVQHQEVINTQAEATHDQEIEHPSVLNLPQPVRVCPAPGVRIVQVPAEAPAVSAGGGAADAGPGPDLRPQLAAFAQKYEAALSDCRRMAAEWPQ